MKRELGWENIFLRNQFGVDFCSFLNSSQQNIKIGFIIFIVRKMSASF